MPGGWRNPLYLLKALKYFWQFYMKDICYISKSDAPNKMSSTGTEFEDYSVMENVKDLYLEVFQEHFLSF